ncbi:hypothetical protein GSI_01353 [Ganoderma sinense ZZ0214-1]|uniref:Uncharacterized protein n=1 Tax=Ganoderma sinense ZZ0214-1 TaxID=1077348 RepID=A0A2G8SV63_9APHY|nr:hypothetical protein GSI_01353 [Ganoderma sinense ZZ0214-1]
MVVCRGCGCSFTNAGWSNHLSQTKDQRCIAVREEEDAVEFAMLAGLPSPASGSTAHAPTLDDLGQSREALEPEDIDMELPDLPNCDLDSPPIFLASNHFGTYASDNYIYHSDCDSAVSRPGSPSPSSEDSEESGDEDEDGWEPLAELDVFDSISPPARGPADTPPNAPAATRIPLPLSENLPGALDSTDIRSIVEAQTATKTYVVSYSKSALAGTPIPGAVAD